MGGISMETLQNTSPAKINPLPNTISTSAQTVTQENHTQFNQNLTTTHCSGRKTHDRCDLRSKYSRSTGGINDGLVSIFQVFQALVFSSNKTLELIPSK